VRKGEAIAINRLEVALVKSDAFTSFAPTSLLRRIKLTNGSSDPRWLAAPGRGRELLEVLRDFAIQAKPNEAVVALALAERIEPRLQR
jgi:hypothetical protein